MKSIKNRLSPRQFLLLLSLCIGLASGLAANLLKWLIHSIEHLLTKGFIITQGNIMYLVYPCVGILLSALFIKFIVRDNIGHGVTKILYALSRNQGFIKGHNCWSSVVASAITIGCGGSVGAESPIVLTGSAIGSFFGRITGMDHRTLMILIGCGASGAVAGIFKAPIAGLVFTIEVLMIDLTMASLVPLLVSCAAAACVSYFISGTSTMFDFNLTSSFCVERVPACALLGVLCGLISLYFTRVMNRFERLFGKIHSLTGKFLLGSVVLALLIYLFPPLYGEGYGTIETLLHADNADEAEAVLNNSWFYGHSSLLLVYLTLIVLVKVFATTATNGGGGCGGTFAPSLFLGCIGGYVFANIWNLSAPFGIVIPYTNYALLGMAGVMSGVFHAPLTGIFLIAELTGGYELLVPLIIVSAVSYITIHSFEPHSIYSMRLARRGELLTHDKDQSVLTLMKLDELTDVSRPTLVPEMTMGKMLQVVSTSKHLHFGVVNAGGVLLGIININELRNIIFRSELYNTFTVQQLMKPPKDIIRTDYSMLEVVAHFSSHDNSTLPVVNPDGVLVGFITRNRLFSEYREIMKDFSQE